MSTYIRYIFMFFQEFSKEGTPKRQKNSLKSLKKLLDDRKKTSGKFLRRKKKAEKNSYLALEALL